MIILKDINKVDERHCVDINNSYSFATATVINEDGSFENITYMTDDCKTWDNEAIIDATQEEIYNYRKHRNLINIGDTVRIISGRKMINEIKIVKDIFNYRPRGTYGHQDTKYLIFTDGTKVNKVHCQLI